jgi:hypothetical protein
MLIVGGGGNDRGRMATTGRGWGGGVRICPESFPVKNLLPGKFLLFLPLE